MGEATAAVVMYCRTLRFLFCFTRRLQLAWLSSDPDHVSAPYPEVPWFVTIVYQHFFADGSLLQFDLDLLAGDDFC